MAVKMILLKTGETLIADAQEVVQEEKVRGYLFKEPQIVRTQEKTMLMEADTKSSNYELDVILSPWMILSSDKEYVVTTDIVATICEPIESVKEMYDNKISFQESLNQAIKNGFAEQDSSADLSGRDANHKLVLLSNLSFGNKFSFSDINYDGIENIKLIDLEQGLKLGYKLKLVSLTERYSNSKFYSSVAPCFVPENSLIAKTDFEENVITLEGDSFIKTSLVGKGAGGYPTATSIISDLKRFISHDETNGVFVKEYSSMPKSKFVNRSDRKRPYYLRMSVSNKVGVLKSIAQIFSQKSISIKSIIQLNTSNEKTVPIVIISDPAGVDKINSVTQNLKKTSFIKKEISVIRIEENIG